ncbi:MAG TPA: hypothetical protein VD962_12210 [Rubricoccaceae bacterium]|nr:hypothetical protein [Rubricoccaceae bacterium]
MVARPLSLFALLTVAAALPAQAQDDLIARRASLFDLGIYAGGAWSSDWFTTPELGGEGEEGWSPGFSSIFGATATYWVSPSFGIRLHGAYMPSSLPEAGEIEHPEDYGMSNWLYDLDLVFRPWFDRGGVMGSTHLFLGGGAISSSATGDFGSAECVPFFAPAGVCISTEGRTSVRGVAGAHTDLTSLGRVTLFGEAALHGFPAPVGICNEGPCEDEELTPGDASRSFVLMPRLELGTEIKLGQR